ncbi:hypothetical protein RBH29_14600 [Herbivorax sp. ANBcel31]|uniref:hypothetical protein n=1 Tax=Herbivorax sp. ANBcel31 TaxID=3069754 RepID=UPI0027AE5178|nr:hypothetical protein [Herbivorax sp. ANBcel31]MDQ2087658.1 hypothetical protein [Herbivorax sp. ANBcel31]
MRVKELKKFMKKYNIEAKGVEYFYDYFNEYKNEHPEEFNELFDCYDSSKIETWLHSVSLKGYNWPELDYCNVVIELKVLYNDEEIGVYQLFYDLNGNITDDVLRIH